MSNEKTVCIAVPGAAFSATEPPKTDVEKMNKDIADKIIQRRADEGAIGFIDRQQKQQREEVKKQFGEKSNGS